MHKAIASWAFIVTFSLLGGIVYGYQPTTGAEAAVLIDGDTEKILYEKNPTKWMHPASTTKMVTFLTALDKKGKYLDQLATVSNTATTVEPSLLGLQLNDEITLRGVLDGMMVSSGNDAAIAVAESVSGSVKNFADDMNRVAKKYGAKSSHFVNPHGLTAAGHHTTARDMAVMAAKAMKNQQFRDAMGYDWYIVPYENRAPESVQTTNLLIRRHVPYVNGLKTGYTEAAGECLIASATKNGRTMIVVLLNDDNRWDDAPRLLDYGFSKGGKV